MDMSVVTKSVEEIATLARQTGANVDKQLAEFTEYKRATDQRVLDLEQKMVTAQRAPARGNREPIVQIAKQLVESEGVRALVGRKALQVSVPIAQSLRTVLKSLITNEGQDEGASPGFGVPSAPDFIAPIPLQAPGRKLLVLNALRHLPVQGATVVVPRVTGSNDGSAVQAYEGAGKGESTVAFEGAPMPLPTVATYANVSRQVLEDVTSLTEFLGMWLRYFVLRRLENLVIAGTGDSDDKISGLITMGTACEPGLEHAADNILFAAESALPAYGYSPSLIILNNSDYVNILSARTTIKGYQGPGWASGINTTLWGIPVVPSVGCTQGKAIVLDGNLVAILDRMEINLMMGWTGNQFTSNEITILAETRANLAIMDPNAVQVLTIETTSG
jgi:HK97 family phage major capsid protein